MHQNLWEGPSLNCNKSSHNGPIEPAMVSFERLASSPVGNAQFPLFWRIKEPQKGIFLSSTWESGQILPKQWTGKSYCTSSSDDKNCSYAAN